MKTTDGGLACSLCIADEHGAFGECHMDTINVRVNEHDWEVIAFDNNMISHDHRGCPVELADGLIKLHKRFPDRKIIHLNDHSDTHLFVAVSKELAKVLNEKIVY